MSSNNYVMFNVEKAVYIGIRGYLRPSMNLYLQQ